MSELLVVSIAPEMDVVSFDLPQGFSELGQLQTQEIVTSGVIIDTHLDLQQCRTHTRIIQ